MFISMIEWILWFVNEICVGYKYLKRKNDEINFTFLDDSQANGSQCLLLISYIAGLEGLPFSPLAGYEPHGCIELFIVN